MTASSIFGYGSGELRDVTHRAASAKIFNALVGRHLESTLAQRLRPFFSSLILVRRALFSLFAFAFLFRTHSGLALWLDFHTLDFGWPRPFLDDAVGDDTAPLLRCVVFRYSISLPPSLSLLPISLLRCALPLRMKRNQGAERARD